MMNLTSDNKEDINSDQWQKPIFDLLLSPRKVIQALVEKAESELISYSEAVASVTTEQVEALLHTQFTYDSEDSTRRYVAKGINASPGAVSGRLFFDIQNAKRCVEISGESVVWVCIDLRPEDVDSVLFAAGWLVARGGATSHAAVVARLRGISCVTGIKDLGIDTSNSVISFGMHEFREGDWISFDGATGLVWRGYSEVVWPSFENETSLQKLLSWADNIRKLRVFANADTPEDVEQARRYGAEGIGVCRTEHMFLEEDVLPLVQQCLLANELEKHLVIPAKDIEAHALKLLLPKQRTAFRQIFTLMLGMPVVIRLLDIPLHEFVPNTLNSYELIRQHIKNYFGEIVSEEALITATEQLHEVNPMLGYRGLRLGILRPAIYEMQVRAIIEAACIISKENSCVPNLVIPKIMIPLTSYGEELKLMKKVINRVARSVMNEYHCSIKYSFGTMIETPRAAITADQVATYAEFFSFGTNDLTQTTLAISRDDAEKGFLLEYIQRNIIPNNPFQQLDEDGVGYLIKLATENGKRTRFELGENLEVGICGEHGGDPTSIMLCHNMGLDYVSCSPARLPIARLAAAHAALRSANRTPILPWSDAGLKRLKKRHDKTTVQVNCL